MYLEHFKIDKLPFSLTPNTEFYCELPGHQEALNVLLISLRNGEGFIKIVGEVGTGKTLLCRKLLNRLGEKFVTAYLPNPDLTPSGLRKALARELGIEFSPHLDQHGLLELINERLLEFSKADKQVVLICDEAQSLTDESLEALRLLTNLETESTKLMQVVLFGQPELDERLRKHSLRQLKQRITFAYNLKPITRKQLDAYICHRLVISGHTQGSLFDSPATDLIYQASGGIPRLVNILCHKGLMVAYGKGRDQVDEKSMLPAIKDTEGAMPLTAKSRKGFWYVSGALLLMLAVGVKYYSVMALRA